ncbi:uncharacterized protein Z518_04715 [Rhinocladiella mackenziei CBS 650.93]|uniref:Mediator of RNA polymerase II transcription subunit 17 n=1 Tax=Rhinocladiella mackenziei CBS 650.93 TaxID=1442369 RepID=A0A0D2ILU0_9EURO|nr:uncharacterized protein Z518_04715 [Rhinocladiella mackenziei CBS 650.93]KIX06739.1 hypothetical protein Z518_04715 [Rhinocladiella mackenziei CBS 650.93]
MPEPNSISLLIPPEPTSRSQDLQTQIQRITAQRGHFRHVTERSLLAEIQGKASAPDVLDSRREDDAQAEEDEPPQKRRERLWKCREEMLERLSYAQNEILCALDFVSLLISKQSTPAQSSMSPALKEAVPAGTLAARVLPHQTLSTSVKRQLAATSQGWRSESFRSASEKLSAASSRLKNDAERESEYWAQVADLTTHGWAVSRLPRDRKAIGVHFGFTESAPQFGDRGFALLRQSDDGTVTLDQQSTRRRRKRLGVYVIRDQVKTGGYHFQTRGEGPTGDIGQQLTDMRDSLFEEELFYEICREARIVANQGIAARAQAVEIDVGGDYQLALVSAEEQPSDVSSTNPEDNTIAEFVGISLRLLLTAAHEQNLIRRSQKPPPMTLKPRPIPEYALLRPILARLRHKSETTAFWNSCQALIRPLKSASVPVSLEMENSNAGFNSLNIEAPDTVLANLMLPAKTGFKISLTGGRSLAIGLATFLGPPLFGSRYETSSIDFGFSTLPAARQETREAAVSFVRQVLMLDLVSGAESLSRQIRTGQDGKSQQWKVSQPHSGELCLYDSDEAVKKVQIAVQPQSFGVKLCTWGRTSSPENASWSWTSTGASRAQGSEVRTEYGVTFDHVLSLILKAEV